MPAANAPLEVDTEISSGKRVSSGGATAQPAERQQLFREPELPGGGTITLDAAVRLALQNSDIVRTLDDADVSIATATSYDASINHEAVEVARAAFDPRLDSSFSWNRFEGPPNSFFGPGIDREDRRDEATFASGLTKRWQAGMETRMAYNPSPGYLFFPNGSTGFNPSHVSALELSLRQPLLQGFGTEVNCAPIGVAQLKTDQSAWEFKEALLDLVRSVEQAYWELSATRVARNVLEEQARLVTEIVRIEEANKAAERAVEADVAKAQTQLYRLRQRIVEANRVIREKELRLGSLIGFGPQQHVSIVPATVPPSAPIVPDRQASIALTVDHQPELIQRRVQTRVRELELMVAKNEYLPQLELQALYRANGLQDDLGSSLEMMADNDFYDWQFGAAFTMPLGRNMPRAKRRAAELQLAREKAELREAVRLSIFQVDEIIVRIEGLYAEYRAANEREEQAKKWLRGARIRYENPPPSGRSDNWLLTALDDLFFAMQASADAAEESAFLLASYNTELARLQQAEGTLLEEFNVCLQKEPWSRAIIQQLPSVERPAEIKEPQPNHNESDADGADSAPEAAANFNPPPPLPLPTISQADRATNLDRVTPPTPNRPSHPTARIIGLRTIEPAENQSQ